LLDSLLQERNSHKYKTTTCHKLQLYLKHFIFLKTIDDYGKVKTKIPQIIS